jgi:hypothetical protein
MSRNYSSIHCRGDRRAFKFSEIEKACFPTAGVRNLSGRKEVVVRTIPLGQETW